ncbi:hypothetical protein SAMN05216526_0324 [Ectothiorhodosinus mongolicus]|uniref:Uncharacterized protein n=1 Tax=Ectothiorhodosinus mongolicus TaxID=233100 RepID=A0A1R3VMT4_9GAMM|nr:hypothetical protein [Ectothiorhodosinus mongolicus]ULX56354.1 hypothetical protein CKX93_00690 [Ectothiorhodosinus mongolicus]SIT65869.1 hypothetical protein SAMN05216526_0324 [Ectothiorhodosinus mongolicus]
MATQNLLAKLTDFLLADASAQRKEIESISKVLKKLKQKEKELTRQMAESGDESERQNLQAQLEVIAVQRRKGRERVREIRDHKN